jgi:hypothetical protein
LAQRYTIACGAFASTLIVTLAVSGSSRRGTAGVPDPDRGPGQVTQFRRYTRAASKVSTRAIA